ncbi:hypothetical protein [Klebsiella phage KN4-1]|uniref:Depolymerase, capsule KN4-specific n=1 Tax=Klebsiella phage KN4-1 TaxID=2282631 RepID=DEPOL_BPK41|nr:tail fiber protein [Klebsiella phage KN4-1]A0A3T0ZBZ8.1 RecName: Full=Depolymerase, capsule KN4-specific; AltName: Full=KN4dep; AltName: Full=Probable tail spike protein [Klebsiella phage KN4-1]BBF66888.1 hypothetical protein [Klebsiella phage KN4-1]
MDQDIKTIIQYPVGATEFDIPFDYLSRKFVRVSLVSDDNRRLLSNITEYRYVSKTRVKLLVATGGFDRVEIRRFTSASERIVDFSDGSVLRAADLNVSQLQSAHIAEEARDVSLMSMLQDDAGNLDAKGRRIVNLSDPVADSDAATKGYVDEGLEHTLRFSESTVQPLPPLSLMDGKILAFSGGKPIGILPESGSAADVLVELSKVSGYNLIGKATSFANMRSASGLKVGDVVLLTSYYEGGTTGGGEFLVKAGSAVDDGGHICVPSGSTNIYLERITSEVHLLDYGILTELNGTGARIDMSGKLQSAINRAKSAVMPLVTGIPSENHYIRRGVYIEKGVDITGIKTITGCLSLLVDTRKLVGLVAPGYPDTKWALVNLNAQFNASGIVFGSTIGNQSFDSIVVRDVSDRGAPGAGQLHVTSGTMVKGALCATGFDGPGVSILGSYDSVIPDIRSVHCGNVAQWGVDIAAYRGSRPDNTNCMTIGRIECHDATDRALRCAADLSHVGEIHIEATLVTSTEQSTSATIADNGWGYANVLLQGLGTSYGSVRDLPVTGSVPPVVEVVADDTVVDSLSLPRSNLSLHYAFTTPRGCLSAGTINVGGDIIVTNGANTNIDSITMGGDSAKLTSASINLNVGILRAVGAASSVVSVGGNIGRLECASATLTGVDVLRGSITSLTLLDRNTISRTTAQSLNVVGTRNYLKSGFRVSGPATLGGVNNSASDTVFAGAVALKDPWKFIAVYINGNVTYSGNTTSSTYDVSFQDVFIEGELLLSGPCRIHADNMRAINMRIGQMQTGFIVMKNCTLSGGVEGNYIGSFNVPPIGSITQNFETGIPSVFTTSGWKPLTLA